MKNCFEEVLFEKSERLVIFMDKLDRCRPSYAVQLLECIEHYFINDRITFVFSANLEQLQHTIKNIYGNDVDACRYLDCFFDLLLSLPTMNTTKYYKSLNLSNNVEIDRVLMRIQQTFNMSLIEFCKFYDSVKVSGMKSYFNETEDFMFKYIVTLCLALKITNITLHDEFIEGKNIQPLLDLYMNDLGERVIYQLRNGMDINKEASINNYLEIKQDLKDLYDAIFIKNYTYNYTSTTIGALVFMKDSKKFISNVESSLSPYSCYDDE